MLHLALRKLGFNGDEIERMTEGEAKAWLLAYNELNNPPKKKTYKVLRKNKTGKGNG